MQPDWNSLADRTSTEMSPVDSHKGFDHLQKYCNIIKYYVFSTVICLNTPFAVTSEIVPKTIFNKHVLELILIS